MPCCSLKDIAIAAVSRQLAVASATETEFWANNPTVIFAQNAYAYIPVEIKWSILSVLSQQGALTTRTLQALWSGELAALVGQLQLSGCCRLTAGSVADCIAASAAASTSVTALAVCPAAAETERPGVEEGPVANNDRAAPLDEPRWLESGDGVPGCCQACGDLGNTVVRAGAGPRSGTSEPPGHSPGVVEPMVAACSAGATSPSAAARPPAGHASDVGRRLSTSPRQQPTVTLRALGLHGCHRTCDEDVRVLLPYCNRLEALDVSACHQLGDETVAAVGAQLSNRLTSLDLSDCVLVSDLTPLHVCSRLRSLRLSGCWRLASQLRPTTTTADGATHPPISVSISMELQDHDTASTADGDEAATAVTAASSSSSAAAAAAAAAAVAAAAGLRRPRAPQIPALLRRTPGLQELDVSGIPGLRDVDLGGLGCLASGGGGGAEEEGAVGAGPASTGGALACSRTLTSLSLSSTSITSEMPPRLAAACPSLAQLRLSYCHQVTGCSVLAAARIRAAQITAVAASGAAAAAATATRAAVAATAAAAEAGRATAAQPQLGAGLSRRVAMGGEAVLRFAGFRVLSAAGLAHWEEEPEAVLGELLIRQLVERARGEVAEVLLARAAAADAAEGEGGCGGCGGGSDEGVGGPLAVRESQRSSLPLQRQGHEGALLGRRGAHHAPWPQATTQPQPQPAVAFVLSAEELGRGGMVEDLFVDSAGGSGGCGAAMEGLTSLDLSETAQFTDMSAARLASRCPRLALLRLAGCGRLTDEGLSHLTALTALTAMDLTGCAPAPGPGSVHRARVPGAAFRRPTSAAQGPGQLPTGGGDSKRPRRGGITDRGLASLLTALPTPSAPPPPPPPFPMPVGIAAAAAAPPPWTPGDGCGGVSGLRSLRLGGTAAGDAALRCLTRGLTRLELAGCRGASDLGVLQALEHCPGLQVLKLPACPQLSAAALGCSCAPTTNAAAAAAMALATPPPRAAAAVPGNSRARRLIKVSLPGTMSYDAAVAWLLGDTDASAAAGGSAPGLVQQRQHQPLVAAGSVAAASASFPGDQSLAAGLLASNALWALQDLDLAPPSVGGGGGGGVTDALLLRLPASCPLLRSVRLRGAAAATDAGAAAVLRGCGLLRRFTLTGSRHVTDATLALALRIATAAVATEADSTEAAPAATAAAVGGAATAERQEEACGSAAAAAAAPGGTRRGVEPGQQEAAAAAVATRGLGRGTQGWIHAAEPPLTHGSAAAGCALAAAAGGAPARGSLLHLDLSGCVAIAGRCLAEELAEAKTAEAEAGQGGAAMGCDGRAGGGGAAAPGLSPPRLPPPPPAATAQPLLLLSLDLEGCPQLRCPVLAALLRRCPHLRELSAPLDAGGLRAAARCCANLRSLKVSPAPAAAATATTAAATAAAQLRAWPGDLVAAPLGGAEAGSEEAVGWEAGGGGQGTAPAAARAAATAAAAAARRSGGGGGGWVWGALTRLELPAALRRDEGLRAWAAARPWMQVTYS